MINNVVLRRVRYIFDLNDKRMMALFKLGQLDLSRAEISDLLRKEDDPAFVNCNDKTLAHFLNGFITHKRGAKEGEAAPTETRLTNNMVLRKLKIALNLSSDDMLAILNDANFRFSKSELGALFRKPGHKNYRDCKDQLLRNFLFGLQQKYRPDAPVSEADNRPAAKPSALKSKPKPEPKPAPIDPSSPWYQASKKISKDN